MEGANMERAVSEYEANAQRIAREIGLVVRAAFKGDRCPPWEHEKGCIHGDRYRVTLKLRGRSLSFDFWNSLAATQANKRPGYYDILSCVGAEASAPTDPDEVVSEYGRMEPWQAVAVAKFAQRLQNFFTEDELRQLSEIQ